MRDILVTIIVFASLPYIFKRPYWGPVMWVWISVMNPHSQGWGFARTYPFAAIIAACMVLSWAITKEEKSLPKSPITATFIVFLAWMSVTSVFAIHGMSFVYDQWIKVNKIFGMTLVIMMLMKERKHIEYLIWSIVISLGYYGVKGGLFTIRSGGNERVWGPEGTFIDGNNEVALALIMVIPLMYYLMLQVSKRWIRYAFIASMGLCALASLGSYSRGALLAFGAMAGVLWLKSKNKATLGILMVVMIPVMVLFMPQQWFNRIDTIGTYKEDSSAMGRINAWHMAFNLASDRPLGGGFEIYDAEVFNLYAPVPADIHAAHSIYFQVLGEHGFVGLFLYVLLGILTWQSGTWIAKRSKGHPQLKWAHDLATMLQVSLLGFAIGGAFLSLVYFDVPYYIMAAMVATRVLVEKELKATKKRARDAKLYGDGDPLAVGAEALVEPQAAPVPVEHDPVYRPRIS
jgi:putative inorganic carbon (HCO3(-)) transporter